MNVFFRMIRTKLDSRNYIYAPSWIKPVFIELANTINRIMIGNTQIMETDFFRRHHELFGGI